LQPRLGDKVFGFGLRIGLDDSASLPIVGKKGKVIGVEKIKSLCDFGTNNISKYNFLSGGRAKIVCADGSKGYVNEAPYSRILVSAAASEIPKELKNQLSVGGDWSSQCKTASG